MGNRFRCRKLGGGNWQAEARLSWGTHLIGLTPVADLRINWMLIAHELFPNLVAFPQDKGLIKRLDDLASGDYLLLMKANRRKDSTISPMGWIEIYDPIRVLTLNRILLYADMMDLPNNTYFKPSFFNGFPIADTAQIHYKGTGTNNIYMAFRTLGGPLEIYYRELVPAGPEIQSMELIPFNNDPETSELLDESAVEFHRGAVDFMHNVGNLDTSRGKPELLVDGEGTENYLAWGFTCDFPEGAYLLEAEIPEESNNFILDLLNDMGGALELTDGQKQLFTIVHGYLTLEARVFWKGKGALRLRSIKAENLAGPLDIGILFKRVEQYYKKNKQGFNIKDVKELQLDKSIRVLP